MSRLSSLQAGLGERSDQLVGRAPRDAARHDQAQVGPHGQLRRDVQRVRHDGDLLQGDERPCDLGRGRASGEADRGSLRDEPRRRVRDPALLLLVAGALVPERQFVEQSLRSPRRRASGGAGGSPRASPRSRRIVAADTPSRRHSSVTLTEPPSARSSRITLNRSAWRIGTEYRECHARLACPDDRSCIKSGRMSEIERELTSQPETWRRAAAMAPRRRRHCSLGPAIVSPRWDAAPRCSSPRPTRASASRPVTARPTRSPPPRRPRTYLRRGAGDLAERNDDRGDPAARARRGRARARWRSAASTTRPVAEAADDRIILGFADERSVVQTRFATGVARVAARRSRRGPRPDRGRRRTRTRRRPPDRRPRRSTTSCSWAAGWTVGLANEAALKLREASGAWAESYPAMEYRHGPISVAGTRSAVWPLGDVEPDLLRRRRGDRRDVVDHGLGPIDPMAELILIQRTAVALAEARGLDPDRPRHLTRSVVLS